jgi:hypothetical protein
MMTIDADKRRQHCRRLKPNAHAGLRQNADKATGVGASLYVCNLNKGRYREREREVFIYVEPLSMRVSRADNGVGICRHR